MDNSVGDLKGMASIICLVQEGNYMVASTNNGSLYKLESDDSSLVLFASEEIFLIKLLNRIIELSKWFKKSKIEQIKKNASVVIAGGREIAEINYDDSNGDVLNIVQDIQRIYTLEIKHTDFSRFDIDFEKIKKIQRCTKCVLPATMPFIEFDEKGVCNYCRGYKKVKYRGKSELNKWRENVLANNMKSMVSFSGGRDSSYGLHYFVKEMGVKPVAYCYDWGMVTDIARRNQSRMCQELGIELILVSADIRKKRENIRKNVEAWLKKPSLGMIPIFMAGDKQYYYYCNKLRNDYRFDRVLMATNPFEKTYFKAGFCGVRPDILKRVYRKLDLERLEMSDVAKMTGYYFSQYINNLAYINSSIVDTMTATMSFYIIPHNYFRLFDYIEWNENEIDNVLLQNYGWEKSPDCDTTWRIGDGTAPFYNYIYCMVAGLTENDTLRSNQIREGMLSRDMALDLVYRDNAVRFDSLKWYFEAIDVDMEKALGVIKKMPKLYER